MKYELIDAFLIKNANKLKLDEKIELRNKLLTCDDKAFALLMSHKKPTTRSNFWRRLFCIIPIAAAMLSVILFGGWLGWVFAREGAPFLIFPSLIFLGVFLVSFLLIKKWYKHGKLKRMPKRRRLYEDYLKIIQSYQEATQSIE